MTASMREPSDLSPRADDRMTDLLHRMRSGDRAAAADFLAQNATRIRRRFRGKLGADVRRVFDSQDLLSTVSRRLDVIVMNHTLTAISPGQLWSLIGSLAMRSIAEHTDKALRHRAFGRSWDAIEIMQADRVELKPSDAAATGQDLTTAASCWERLDSKVDWAIVRLRTAGQSHRQIAEELGTSSAAVRKRWQRIRQALGPKRGRE